MKPEHRDGGEHSATQGEAPARRHGRPCGKAPLVAVLLAVLSGCSKEPPEFFLVPDRTRKVCHPPPVLGRPACTKSERFIIANCPSDPAKLIAAVHAFDDRTLTNSELARWGSYTRYFYRETWSTPRDFKSDDQDWGGDSLEDHWQDIVLSTDYSGSLASRQTSYWRDGVAEDPP